MADRTAIEWAANADGSPGATWNPIRSRRRADGKLGWFCVHESEGCRNCYAERINEQHFGNGLSYKKQNEAEAEIFLDEETLKKPLSWKKPRTIFVCSMTDLFADFVKDAWIDRVFAVAALCPQHTFIVLTKRARRLRVYSNARRPNVWLGVSAEDQKTADARVPDLLATPAAVRFLSCEPLLGPINLQALRYWLEVETDNNGQVLHGLDWIIVGGESGPNARPMHPDWARGLRDQCAEAGVPFFFKQWGEWAPVYDRDKDDPDWRKCDLVKRKTPRGQWLNLAGGQGFHGARVCRVDRLGKHRAGRLLDHAEHTGCPTLANGAPHTQGVRP